MNRGVYSVTMLSSPFLYQGKQIKPANNKAFIFIELNRTELNAETMLSAKCSEIEMFSQQ
jgi:hypothetical protein